MKIELEMKLNKVAYINTYNIDKLRNLYSINFNNTDTFCLIP